MRTITVIYDGTLYTYTWLKTLLCLKPFFNKLGFRIQLLDILSYLPVSNICTNQIQKALKNNSYDIVLLAFHHSTSSLGKMSSDDRLKLLYEIKSKTKRLVWLDTADSTGSCMFDVMPAVDKYLKKQIYKDINLYKTPLYLDRLYSDYYNRELNLHNEYVCKRILLQDEYVYKLGISWNAGLNDFLSKGFVKLIPNYIKYPKYKPAGGDRVNDVFFNGTTNYESLISYQRQRTCELLRRIGEKLNVPDPGMPMNHKQYIDNMKNSKSCISPFGWGEICYRDFESFFYGATLLKPTVNHLETYPNFFIENETYIPIDWSFRNIEEVFERVKSKEYEQIAKNGQKLYIDYIRNKKEEIAIHIINSIMN